MKPDWSPVAICSGPTASWIPFFKTHLIHFPIILPYNKRAPEFLFRGIWHATNTSRVCLSTIFHANIWAKRAFCYLSYLSSLLNFLLFNIMMMLFSIHLRWSFCVFFLSNMFLWEPFFYLCCQNMVAKFGWLVLVIWYPHWLGMD